MSRRHPSWDSWYDLAVWQKRKRFQLQVEPFCRSCAARGDVTIATIVDHIEPHRGDWNKFRLGAVQSLCHPCHNGEKRMVESRGFDTRIGADGMPVDPKHPIYNTAQRHSRAR